MPNRYFQFKQFAVQQENCAMKVCTDACLFGAWVASIIQTKKEALSTILDIGTGTGLLSLMLAQKLQDVRINAIEIDAAAAKQAQENFASSPWFERLQIQHASIQEFGGTQHDFIISNPPFFENDLKSTNTQRNIALHSASLTLEGLLYQIQKHLSSSGSFAVLLPYHRSDYFENLAQQKGLYLQYKVAVKQTPKHPFFRSMLYYATVPSTPQLTEIIIKTSEGLYTEEFSRLLKDYYLHL